jgi:hypothetical protein
MQRFCFLFLLLQSLTWLALGQSLRAAPAAVRPIPISIGRSVFVLSGPWKFRTGDDLRWSGPGFDDSGWESVDLTAAPGAHDADVGLSGYLPGWTAKGHSGYSGYGWYRITVSVTASSGQILALAGPPDVDDAYQVFFNGRLLGSAGDFSGSTPTVYSIQPRIFPLPDWVDPGAANVPRTAVIAFRVWMSARSAAESSDAGGIHIAPALGEVGAIAARYRLQWLETFCGYVVDAIEPVLFVVLAIMACALVAFDPSDPAYLWLAIALLLTALVRSNQPFFFWAQYESVRAFELAKNVVLVPLALGAWLMAWRSWFGLERFAWIPEAVVALTLLYMGSELMGFLSSSFILPQVPAVFHNTSSYLRLVFFLLLVFIVYPGSRRNAYDRPLAVSAVLAISVGLFASELSALHVPGIWFPYGTGVSRTQFAYAAFDLLLFALLLRRTLRFARSFRQLTVASKGVAQP